MKEETKTKYNLLQITSYPMQQCSMQKLLVTAPATLCHW